ncbi:MAG: hypothetical protein ACU0BF_00100 [Paracoccaceae bacterium]
MRIVRLALRAAKVSAYVVLAYVTGGASTDVIEERGAKDRPRRRPGPRTEGR